MMTKTMRARAGLQRGRRGHDGPEDELEEEEKKERIIYILD